MVEPIVKPEFSEVHHGVIDVKCDNELGGNRRSCEILDMWEIRERLVDLGGRKDGDRGVVDRMDGIVTAFHLCVEEERVQETETQKGRYDGDGIHLVRGLRFGFRRFAF